MQEVLPSIYSPDAKLSDRILFYGVVELDEDNTEYYLSPPLGLTGMIIQLQSSTNILLTVKSNLYYPTDKFKVTSSTSPAVSDFKPKKSINLLIFFQPLGMYELFGLNMKKCANISMSLLDFVGVEKSECLANKLNKANDSTSCVFILDDFFKSQKPAISDLSGIRKVLDFIHVNGGNVSIKQIENACFMHRKCIERHFQLKVGLSPKNYASIYRFKCLMSYLQRYPKTTWRQLSNRNGYYDQSHMARYFKEYLNIAPNGFVKMNVDFINFLSSK